MTVKSMKAFGLRKNTSIWLRNISKSNKKAPNPNFPANLIVIHNKNSSNVFEQKYIFISLSIKIEKNDQKTFVQLLKKAQEIAS